MSVETVARRYSVALADVVIEKGETEPVQTELKTWVEMISSNDNLREVFKNPTISHARKERVLEGLIEKTKPTKTTANFLRILLKNSRLTNISEISDRFANVLDERNGIVAGHVTSAREMTGAEKSELLEALLKITGKQVNLDFSVDAHIIGGVIARVGTTVYDASVRTQLDELRNKLVNG